MTELCRPIADPCLSHPGGWASPDLPSLLARLLALATASVGDRDEAEDLVQETLIAAWRQHADLPPGPALEALLGERCRCWRAGRREEGAALGRLIAAGVSLPPWLTGWSPTAVDGEVIVELAVLRVTIAERIAHRATTMAPNRTTEERQREMAARPLAIRTLPPVPTDLAAACPIAAALVRAGAATGPATTSRARRPRQRAELDTPATARPSTGATRRDRLEAQLRERTRAVERSARALAEARRHHDLAVGAAAARVVAGSALAAAAARHERSLAAWRSVGRLVAEQRESPGRPAVQVRRGQGQ